MPSTYEPIATTTFTSSVGNVTFSSIPQTYTDLVVVMSYTLVTTTNFPFLRFNGDSGSNYSNTILSGNGSTATSTRSTSTSTINLGIANSSNPSNFIFSVPNYTNTTTFKNVLSRHNSASSTVAAIVGLYRSTSAITEILLDATGNFATGTATLYGIKAA
jgi:hypothetical protein